MAKLKKHIEESYKDQGNVRGVLTTKWIEYTSDYPEIISDKNMVEGFQELLSQISQPPEERDDGIQMPRTWDHVRHLAKEIVYIGPLHDQNRKWQDTAVEIYHKIIDMSESVYGKYDVPPPREEVSQ